MESDLISWLVEQIVSLILDLLVLTMTTLSANFEELMGLSASWDTDTTLDTFFKIFLPNSRGGGSDSVYTLVVACGVCLLYGILIFQLFKGLFGPLSKAESPVRLLGKSLLFAILVVNARNICHMFFYLGSIPYEILVEQTSNIGGLGEAFSSTISGAISVKFGGAEIADTGLAGIIITPLLSIIMMFSILVNYVKLMIEIVERYIILGVLSFFSPLCIATGASENTNQIFKSWIKMMFSQCILMCMSVFFLSVFEESVTANTIADFPETSGFIILLMYLAWLRTGQRIDSHMSTLGLSVAQSGGGLWGDLFAGGALMKAVASPGSTALGKMANNAIGIAQAGGLGAWLASPAGAKWGGQSVSDMARGFNTDKQNAKSGEYAAKTNPYGRISGQPAIAGLKGKYGNAVDASGKSLNDRLKEGHSMVNGTMTANSGVMEMQDPNGNRYHIAWGDNKNGDPHMSADFGDNSAARKAYNGLEDAKTDDASQMKESVGGGAMNSSDLETTSKDANGNDQNVDGMVNKDGFPEKGTPIYDEEGNFMGVADGQGNTISGVPFAQGEDGKFYDVSGAEIDENGNFVKDGEVMKDDEGNALSIGDTAASMVTGADGQQYDVSGATIDENGNFVKDDKVMTDDDGNALKAEGIETGTMVTDGNGNTTNISDAIQADGSLRTNDANNLIDKDGNEIKDAQQNPISADSFAQKGTAIAGANEMAALNADGSYKTNAAGNIIGLSGNELKDQNGNAIAANGIASQQTLLQGTGGNLSNISDAVRADGSLRANKAGNLIDANGKEIPGANGKPISADSIAAHAAFVAGPNGITNVSAAMGANGQPMVNKAGNLIDGKGNEIKDSQGNAISGNSQIQTGILAKGNDGQLHNVTGASLNANGNFIGKDNKPITDSNGNAIVSSGIAHTAAVTSSGAAVNISSAIGANGQLMTNKAGNLVNANQQELQGANGPIAASSIAQAGLAVKGSDGQYYNISSAMGANGQLMSNKAGNLIDGTGKEIPGANGAPIAASSVGIVSTGAMSVSAGGGNSVQNVTGATMSSSGTATTMAGSSASINGITAQGNGSGYGVNQSGNLTYGSGREIKDVDGNSISAAGLSVNQAGNYTDSSGKEIISSTGGPIAAAGVHSNTSIGSMAMGRDGELHDISHAINSSGTGIDSSAIKQDANGSSYITAADGAHIPVSGNQVIGGTYEQTNGYMNSNTSLQPTTKDNVSAGQETYNKSDTGSLAFANGGMHSISNVQSSDGSINPSAIKSDSQGYYVNANDGTRVAVSNTGAVLGGTFEQANAQTGAFVISSGSVPVVNGHVSTSSSAHSGVTTYNEGGGLALGKDGQMHDVSNSLTPSGKVQEGAIRSDNEGRYINANDGTRIAVNDSNYVSGGTYSQASNNSGTYAIGHDAKGNAAMAYANGNLGVFQMGVSDSSAVHQTYDKRSGNDMSSGDYVHAGGGYKQIYSGPDGGGRTASGDVQRYRQNAQGSYEPDATGSYVKCSDGNGGSSFVNTGAKANQSIQTYDQGTSYFRGMPMSQGSDGNYNIGFNKNASVTFDGNGNGVADLGNGYSLALTQKAPDVQAPAGAYLTTTYNGKEYYAQPIVEAGAGINNLNDFYKAATGATRDAISAKSGKGENVYTGGPSENARFFKHHGGVMTVIPDASQRTERGTVNGISYFPASALDGKQAYSSSDPNVTTVKIGGKDYIGINSTINLNAIESGKGSMASRLADNVKFRQQVKQGGATIPQATVVKSYNVIKTRQQNARTQGSSAAAAHKQHFQDIERGRK